MKYLSMLMLLVALLLPGCLSAPAQAQQDTQAGRSEVVQSEHNERGSVTFPANQTITFNGNVGNVTLLDQSGEITGDQGGGLTNQGSTEATQTSAADLQAAIDAALEADLNLTK